jgi:hypothetical protein
LITFSTLNIEDLIREAGVTFLGAKVENASFGTIEACLLLILDEGSVQGTAGEIVA